MADVFGAYCSGRAAQLRAAAAYGYTPSATLPY
jgi:hypothetical protein